MRISRTSLAALGLAGVVAAGVAIPAIAQDTATDDTATTWQARRGMDHEEFAAALAEELGLDEATVSEAIDTVREAMRAERRAEMRGQLEDRLAAAVEAGDLTQEQADAILEAHDSGAVGAMRELGFGFRGRGGHGPGMGQAGGGFRGMAG